MKAGKNVLVLLIVSTAAVNGRCPDQSLIKPCDCLGNSFYSNVQCKGVTSVDQLQKAIDDSRDYPFNSLFLISSNLSYLNSTWFVEKHTTFLALLDMTLIALFDNPLTSEEVPLMRDVYVYDSVMLRGLQWEDFGPFVRLVSLNLERVEVKELGQGFRENVSPELKRLEMTDTKTVVLEDGVFRGKKLFRLTISNNRLKVLKNSYFEDTKESLDSMDFSNNPIESLPNDLFQGFQRLRVVFLSGANIKRLPKVMFEDVHSNIFVEQHL